jgi:hypothetical protein
MKNEILKFNKLKRQKQKEALKEYEATKYRLQNVDN